LTIWLDAARLRSMGRRASSTRDSGADLSLYSLTQ
jgi:hypothetical protein